MSVDREKIKQLGKELLIAIGEDPNREGIVDTPKRFAKWWTEFIDYDAGDIERTFEISNANEIVAVTGIKVWSLCEHHLLPFNVTLSIGYIPNKKVLGLSKFARIAYKHAHKLQVQERLVNEIADELKQVTNSEDVAVIGSGEHLCMTMRGIKTFGSMKTSVMRGRFKDINMVRQEFLNLVRD
jgi:GTP cyclohydrolase I